MTAEASPQTGWARFVAWRRRRPFVGGLLLVLSGLEIFFSGQLDLGNIKIQLGFEGFQATVIPALLAVLGVLVIVSPAQRMFYGIFALILAVYSLVGVNLGGFFVGMLLGAVGGVLTVAWRAKDAPAADAADAETAPAPAESARVGSLDPALAEGQAEDQADDQGEDRRDAAPARHGGPVHAEAVDFATLRSRIPASGATAASLTVREDDTPMGALRSVSARRVALPNPDPASDPDPDPAAHGDAGSPAEPRPFARSRP